MINPHILNRCVSLTSPKNPNCQKPYLVLGINAAAAIHYICHRFPSSSKNPKPPSLLPLSYSLFPTLHFFPS
ncbi:hypothetical protein Syun_025353 [Stephania yunnanensis]|uniref:Uncharacterized protein n=1 Tax=Stephania yunnanensis TaxID=152371 RepID=A0AAP0HR70_9MAGN